MLIVDDCSSDGSEVFLRSMAEDRKLTLISRSLRSGVGSAHKQMIAYAQIQQYDFLLTMDADGTHRVEDISKFFQSEFQFDILIGSRFMSGAELIGWHKLRELTTKIAHFINGIATGQKIDCTSGFRLYNLRKRDFSVFIGKFADDYRFFYQSTYWSIRNGYRIEQIPVSLRERGEGKSKMGVRYGWKLSLQMTVDSLLLFCKRISRPRRYL